MTPTDDIDETPGPANDLCEAEIDARDAALRAIAERCTKLMGPGPSAMEHGDLLYDEQGLPR